MTQRFSLMVGGLAGGFEFELIQREQYTTELQVSQRTTKGPLIYFIYLAYNKDESNFIQICFPFVSYNQRLIQTLN